MDTFYDQAKTLQREILDLKTAQKKPSILNTYKAIIPIAEGYYTNGLWTWTITYEDDGTNSPPITTLNAYTGMYLRPATGNTQKVCFYSGANAYYISALDGVVLSSRKILSITQDQTPLQNEWEQVRYFYPSAMGTTPGWCLQNCRKGFLIPSGTFPNAVSDMQSQRNNGTLHPFNGATETPPPYISCPVYINIAGVADGHVCVWHQGTIWNDGYTVAKFTDMGGYIEVWGWGELCDGTRVVQHI